MTNVTTDQPAHHGHLITSQARWSAILAGVAVALSLLCVLQLFGLAIGVSIVDLSDAEAFGEGLGVGAVIWSIISWCASMFLGAMLTARLSGEGNEDVGLLNGVTLWAVTGLIVLALAFSGAASIVGGTFSLASSAVSASASAVQSTGAAVGSAASALTDRDSIVADEVAALLKEEASEAVAGATGPRGPSADEVRRSIEQIDAETMRAFAGHLADGNIDAATAALADDIPLSQRDLRRLAERASTQIQQMLGTADNNQPLSEDLMTRARSTLAAGLADLDRPGGPDVSEDDLRAALDDLDLEVMRTIAWRLIQGNPDGARDALVANTSLTRAEADDLIAGIEADLQGIVGRYREQAEEFADEAGDFAQAVLWVAFLVSALSLASAGFGGWLGTRPVSRRTATAIARPQIRR